MKIFGIIGRPLGHSFSKSFFEDKFRTLGLLDECRYDNFELPSIDGLPEILASNPDLRGFNVTIPYKKEIVPFLDTLSPEAEAIGAVNCVRVAPDGKLTGYNTDTYGFAVGLEKLLAGARVKKTLILGNGGAAAAVRYVLAQKGIEYQTVTRADYGKNFNSQFSILNSQLIINCTPLGTYPDVEGKPDIPYAGLTGEHFLYDLVYNPPLTAFLREGQSRGARILNGETMLFSQAERSWEIWQ